MMIRTCMMGMVLGIVLKMQGATIVQWTFETSLPTTGGPVSAEFGSGTALCNSSTSGFSNPSGNGSNESWSARGWDLGDYYQFQLSMAGYENVELFWSQTRSADGPSVFDLSYSTDGASYLTYINDYGVLENALGNGGTWTPSTHRLAYDYNVNLSSVAALQNAATVYFRLVAQATDETGLGTVRVDDFRVSADVIPEPSAEILLLGGIGVIALLRRRFV